MAVSGVTNTGATDSSAAQTGQMKSLGQDDFLKLLLTQLQNQDPSNTMDDKQFIAQLAQFSSLEQTNNMATGLKNMAANQASTQAMSMIGKSVQYLDPNSGDTMSGKVASVRMSSDGPSLMVGDKQLALSDIIGVDGVGTNDSSTQAIGMLGQSVRYIDPSTGAPKDGKVDAVDVSADAATLMVNGNTLKMSDILGVNSSDSSSANNQAMALIGKSVTYDDPVSQQRLTGTVNAVRISGSSPALMIGDTKISMSDIVSVG